MVNSGRLLNAAIFTLEESVQIGGITLQPGFQKLFRENETYYFSQIGCEYYAAIPQTFNAEVLRAVFSRAMFFGAP